MPFENVYRVETINVTMGTEVVNLMLKHGWKLLDISTTAYWDTPQLQTSSSFFVMGATKQIYENYSFHTAQSDYDKHKWDDFTDGQDGSSFFD